MTRSLPSSDTASDRPLDRLQRWRGYGPVERSMVYARLSVGVNVVMAAWKLELLAVTSSPLLLLTAAFSLGMAGCKIATILAHRRGDDPARLLRSIGAVTTVLALIVAAASAVPAVHMGLGAGLDVRVAAAIAAFTCAEIGIAGWGSLVAHRRKEPLLEAMRITSLSSGLMLMPLAQSVLLSLRSAADAQHSVGPAGVAFALTVAAIGIAAVRSGRRAASPDTRTRSRLGDVPLLHMQ